MGRSRKSIKTEKVKKVRAKDETVWYVGHTNKENALGFCHNPGHKGYLSSNAIKKHECLGKQCKFFSKYENKAYWVRKDLVKVVQKWKKNPRGYILIDELAYQTDDVEKLFRACMKIRDKEDRLPEIQYVLN